MAKISLDSWNDLEKHDPFCAYKNGKTIIARKGTVKNFVSHEFKNKVENHPWGPLSTRHKHISPNWTVKDLDIFDGICSFSTKY